MGFSGGFGRGSGGSWRGRGRSVGRRGGRGRGYGHRISRGGKLGAPTWGDEPGPNAERGGETAESGVALARERREEIDSCDVKGGVVKLNIGEAPRLGWLYNMVSTSVLDPISGRMAQAADLFFLGGDGEDFRATMVMRPYLYVAAANDALGELEHSIHKAFPELIASISLVPLEDLDEPNHLATKKKKLYLKIECWTGKELSELRQGLWPFFKKTQASGRRIGVADAANMDVRAGMDLLVDMREYDVPPLNRIAIDHEIRAGYWYRVDPDGMSGVETDCIDEHGEKERTAEYRSATIQRVPEILERGTPTVLAFDIECTKEPLKFPDADNGDKVIMISWMVDGQGYLCVNREVVAEDIAAFNYTPKPEFPGHFEIFNDPDEKSLLQTFFREFRKACPRVVVTYNGDNFDLPFIEKRADANGLNMHEEIGMRTSVTNSTRSGSDCRSRTAVHMDCLYWVNRDSYLPQGSRGLKAVTRTLLGYDPLELDPEEMLPAARTRPQLLASYSVSDAVCTYYLYMKYVHPFVFSLCNILPLNPDDVLRKGSGTLCELLLLSEAKKQEIVAPNKHESASLKTTGDGKILESETYIGGHVEALQSGVFRSDLPMKFRIDPTAIDELEQNIERVLRFAIEIESKLEVDRVTNLADIKMEILERLQMLKQKPVRTEKPLIYHLDVAAMYPNIILTNRLQPHAIVTNSDCAACDFNGTSDCQRYMKWTWRGELYMPSRSEIEMLKRCGTGGVMEDLTDPMFMKRLKDYSKRNYRKVTDSRIQEKMVSVCQRENPFYVDTVRAFRDRRYDYKQMLKRWKSRLAAAERNGAVTEATEAKGMIVLYDSLQLAHKCILNSFYGYVMRRGARWYSMEMAGVVTQTGAGIIRGARELIERVGIPLELDTDGIWCTLPTSFPENFTFHTDNGKSHTINFLCSVFNQQVAEKFSNDQYQELISPDSTEYEVRRECSIFFELDGPYKAMILPASKEENKSIKKRYAVFDDDGKMVELKGFEMKRRGELKLVKVFQREIFDNFLGGSTLEECYEAVGQVANRFLDVLEQQADMYTEDDVIDLLVEQNNMSRCLVEYLNDGQKSSAITTAKRLGELLGEQVIRDKVTCKYIICRKPEGLQVTERAIPVQVFGTDPLVRKAFLRRWTKESEEEALALRELIDWDYYAGRLVSSIQKIICIPAALQQVENPVPRIELPDWLQKKAKELRDPRKQTLLGSFVVASDIQETREEMKRAAEKLRVAPKDIEDITSHLAKVDSGPRVSRFSKRIDNEQTEESTAEKPEMRDGYVPWLRYMKRQWIAKRRRQKLEKLQKKRNGYKSEEDAEQVDRLPLSRKRRVGGIGAFLHPSVEVQANRASISKSLWQVLSVVPGDLAGVFKMWILPLSEKFDDVVGDVTCVQLHVARKFYVNSFSELSPEPGTPIARILPRNRERQNLYQVVLPEDEFQTKARQLSTYIRGANVEGLYETKTPLLFDAIVRLGCLCKPRKSVVPNGKELAMTGISIEDLQPFGSSKRALYLARKGDLYHFFLFGVNAIDGSGRGIFVLLFPEMKVGTVVIVAPRGVKLRIDAQKICNEVAKAMSEPKSPIMEFETVQVRSKVEAGKMIGKSLARIRESQHFSRRVVACVQIDLKQRELLRVIPALNSVPVILLPSNNGDSLMQPVQWEVPLMKTAIKRYFHMRGELERKTTLSRCADIPVGNLSTSDPYMQVIDVSFARELRNKSHILWTSDGERPDLGGHEEDDNVFAEDAQANPECSSPGAYRTICIESELMNLAVGSVLASSQMSEMEGTELAFDLSTEYGTKGTDESLAGGFPLDDLAGSVGAFRVLRDLVAKWDNDASSSKDADAREASANLLDHFCRWLGSDRALMYDPALHRFVKGIMTKIFWHLITELKQLGTTVIYASISRIIIAAPRDSEFEGLRYAAFVENILKEKPLFQRLRFAPLLGIYRSLVFMDPFNFGGVPAREEEAILGGKVQASSNSSRVYGSRSLPDTRMKWAITRALPSPIDVLFTQIVESFVRRPLLDYMERVSKSEQTAPAKNGSDLTNEVRAFVKRSSQELYETVHDIQVKTPTLVTPEILALRRKLGSPPVEFVNALMAVFSLDESAQSEVATLRRGLLQMLNVREFSKTGQFSNPMSSFVLPNTICSYCKIVVDLDVTQVAPDSHPSHPWLCAHCDHPHDKRTIELALVREAQSRLALYQVQDLQCKKCKLVKQDHLQEYCKCTGTYELTIQPSKLEDTFSTLWAVAKQNSLQYLECVTETFLGRSAVDTILTH